jgi:hypothetical protein
MKSIPYILITALLTSFLWWWLYRPFPCYQCSDPLLVRVIKGTPASIKHHWNFIQSVKHNYNNTATSSISIVPDGITSINSVANDSVTTTISLVGIDSLVGVHCISIKGISAYGCAYPGGGSPFLAHGIIPIQQECSPLTTCCFRSMEMTAEKINSSLGCGDRIFLNGNIILTGVITNCNGVSDTVNLTVVFH